MERDYAASDSAQLSVKEGELVYVKQKDPSAPQWMGCSKVHRHTLGRMIYWC